MTRRAYVGDQLVTLTQDSDGAVSGWRGTRLMVRAYPGPDGWPNADTVWGALLTAAIVDTMARDAAEKRDPFSVHFEPAGCR